MMTKTMLLVAVGSLAGVHAARADDYESVDSYSWREPAMYSHIGLGMTIGGGVTGFTDQQVRDATDTRVGGLWSARATIGTHTPIGLDIAYNGTAVKLASIAGFSAGNLVGTNVEAALRYNILPHYVVNPYVFGGVGWQRYNVTSSDLSRADSGISNKDDFAVYPMGVGVAYRTAAGLVLDMRGTFRVARNSDLLMSPTGNNADLHTWDAGGNLGYEF